MTKLLNLPLFQHTHTMANSWIHFGMTIRRSTPNPLVDLAFTSNKRHHNSHSLWQCLRLSYIVNYICSRLVQSSDHNIEDRFGFLLEITSNKYWSFWWESENGWLALLPTYFNHNVKEDWIFFPGDGREVHFSFFLSLLEPCLWCSIWYITIRVTPTFFCEKNGVIK